MIVNGKISRMIRVDKSAILEFEIPLHHASRIDELDKDVLYSLNIQKATSKKSLNQNKTAWLIMNDIAKREEVFPDVEKVYLALLKMSKIKTMHLIVSDIDLINDEELEDGKTSLNDEELVLRLKSIYRVVIIHGRFENDKGYMVSQVEVALGMSTFDKPKMTLFIDKLLFYAEYVGIDTRNYEFLRG